jgi:hypothetical protein
LIVVPGILSPVAEHRVKMRRQNASTALGNPEPGYLCRLY